MSSSPAALIGEPQRVFEMIEEDLRARLAVPVESEYSASVPTQSEPKSIRFLER
jgi:hypothetical protein